VWWRKHDNIFSRFDRVPACDGRTDRRTDGQTSGPISITCFSIADARKNRLIFGEAMDKSIIVLCFYDSLRRWQMLTQSQFPRSFIPVVLFAIEPILPRDATFNSSKLYLSNVVTRTCPHPSVHPRKLPLCLGVRLWRFCNYLVLFAIKLCKVAWD